MKIETTKYEIAPLNDDTEALAIIQEAERRIAEQTGREVTLIAYSPPESCRE